MRGLSRCGKINFSFSHLNSRPIIHRKNIWTATAPIDHVFVLAFAAQMAFPICHVQIIVYVSIAECCIPQYGVEKALQNCPKFIE